MFGFGAKKGRKRDDSDDEDNVSDSELSSEDEDLGGGKSSSSSSKRESSMRRTPKNKTEKEKEKEKKKRRSQSRTLGEEESGDAEVLDNDDDDNDDDDELGGANPRLRSSSKGKGKGKGKDKGEGDVKSKRSRKHRRQEEQRKKEEHEAHSKELASRELVTARDLRIRPDKDDMELAHKALHPAEVAAYVSVSVLPEHGPVTVRSVADLPASGAVAPVFELGEAGEVGPVGAGRVLVPQSYGSRLGGFGFGLGLGAGVGVGRRTKWREEVFVESASSGRFSRVLYDLDEHGKRVAQLKSVRDEQVVSQFSPQRLRAIMDNVEYILEGVFMVGQGLLSGGSLFQLIVVLQISDPNTFLSIYGPISAEVRRMFFFLSVLSFVGVCDKITAERNLKKHWAERGAGERAEMIIYGGLFFLCLTLSLLTWPLVHQINTTFEASELDPGLQLDADFEDVLEEWRVIIGLRFGFAALGWLLVCKDTNRDLLRGRKRFDQVEKLHGDVEAGREEVARHSGKMLDGVSMNKLHNLQRTLATGLEEVKLQLAIRGQNNRQR